MRRKFSFLLLLVLSFGTAIVINVSCEKDKDENEGATCETVTLSNGESVKACCTSSNCYYEWNGKKYQCDGYACNDAADRLVKDMNAAGKSAFIDNESLKNEILLRCSDVP